MEQSVEMGRKDIIQKQDPEKTEKHNSGKMERGQDIMVSICCITYNQLLDESTVLYPRCAGGLCKPGN